MPGGVWELSRGPSPSAGCQFSGVWPKVPTKTPIRMSPPSHLLSMSCSGPSPSQPIQTLPALRTPHVCLPPSRKLHVPLAQSTSPSLKLISTPGHPGPWASLVLWCPEHAPALSEPLWSQGLEQGLRPSWLETPVHPAGLFCKCRAPHMECPLQTWDVGMLQPPFYDTAIQY